MREFFKGWWYQTWIALDQLANAALTPPFTLVVGFADETLSARCWRGYVDGKRVARFAMPLIDWAFAFFGQKPDPEYRDEHGVPIAGHCRRAFEKELRRIHQHPGVGEEKYRRAPTEGAS